MTEITADLWKDIKVAVERLFPARPDETFESWLARARTQNSGRRALIAAALVNVSRDRQRAAQGQKNAWIASARLSFAPGHRKPCSVCGRFKGVAQAHHVVPLNWQYDRGQRAPDHESVWLCPTHHAIVHLLLDTSDVQKLGRRAATVIDDLTPAEYDAVVRLLTRAGAKPR